MHRQQRRSRTDRRRSQGGFALVTAIVVLVLVSSVVINLIDYSSEELQSGGRRAHDLEESLRRGFGNPVDAPAHSAAAESHGLLVQPE